MSPIDQAPSDQTSSDEVRLNRQAFLRLLLGAVAVLFVAEVGGRFVTANSSFGDDLLPRLLNEHRSNAEARDAAGQETDILFFGSSTAGAAFDPNQVAGGGAYDLWWAGAGTETLQAFGEGFALTLFDAETVVIGITSREMNDSRAIENGAVLADATRSLAWRRVANDDPLTALELAASDVSVLVRERADLRFPTSWISWAFVGQVAEGLTTDDTGRLTRYRDRPEPVMSQADLDRELAALADYEAGGAQADGLADLLETMKGDRRVVVVFLPVSYEDYAPLHPNGRADIDSARAVVAEVAGAADVEFLDASDLGEDRTLFGDSNHLNQRGSEQLTQRVLEYLSVN